MQAEINANRYDRCSCCLSDGKHNNFEVVHLKMLRKYVNIIMKWDSGITPVICSNCVNFLQEVQRFREMVISSQRQLLNVHGHITVNEIDNRDNYFEDNIVKKEEDATVDFNSVVSDNIESPNITSHEDASTTEAELSAEYLIDWETLEDVECDVKNKKNPKNERKRKRNDTGVDFKKRTKFNPKSEIVSRNKNNNKPLLEIKIEKDTDTSIASDKLKEHPYLENKKIRSNMLLILKHSTILPFRNNFKCFYCDKLCMQCKELKQHVNTEHKNVSDKTISKTISSLPDIFVTADVSYIICKLCEEEFKSIENLIEHLCNTHKITFHETEKKPSHGILPVDLSSDRLKCHICYKEFNYLKYLSEHINEHYGSIVCYVCGKQFVSEHRYQSHMYRVHTNREFNCKHCGQIFSTESTMVYHIRKVHSKPVIKCVKCPQTFPLGQYAKRLYHMADVHGMKKPIFKCLLCGKEYANSGSLAAHKRYIHKRTAEFKCEICGYVTVRRNVMKIHMDVHNGVKNHECEYCKKKFTKLYTLNMHLRSHFDDNMFVCHLCDDEFLEKNSLICHYKSKHPFCGTDEGEL